MEEIKKEQSVPGQSSREPSVLKRQSMASQKLKATWVEMAREGNGKECPETVHEKVKETHLVCRANQEPGSGLDYLDPY